jgi:ribonuclease HI
MTEHSVSVKPEAQSSGADAFAGANDASLVAVDIFTDGGCSPNPGAGAWAALLRFKGIEKEISGYEAQTTNNRMELSAALHALRTLNKPAKVRLHTDSQYLQQGMLSWMKGWLARGWKTADKKTVLNADIWQALLAESKRHSIEWIWVRAHNGHVDNERVDALVQKTRANRGKPP